MSLIYSELKFLFEKYKLFENRFNYLLKTYGEKLLAAAIKKRDWKDDYSDVPDEHLEQEKRLDTKYILRKLEDADPTSNKQCLQWLVLRYITGNFRLEDTYRTKITLTNFIKYKNRLQQKDINQYKGLADLEDVIEPLLNTASSNREEKKLVKGAAKKIFEQGDVLIIIPKTEEAACYYGANTKWCTAADEDNMFDDYNSEGPLYILIDKKHNRKYQFHYQSRQFMNERDEPVEFTDILHTYPEAGNFLLDYWGVIKSARAAYEFISAPFGYLKTRIPRLEKIIASDPLTAVRYAEHVIEGKWPEGEAAIATDAKYSMDYANILKAPFKLGEKAIATNADLACDYAELLGTRFPEGEKSISKLPNTAYQYAKYIIKGRWPEGEAAIATDANSAFRYATYVIKGRWPPGEEAILADEYDNRAIDYVKTVIKGPWPKAEPQFAQNIWESFEYANYLKKPFPVGEPIISIDAEYSYKYAFLILHGRFSEGEKSIARSSHYSYLYARDVIKGRFSEGEEAIKSDYFNYQRYQNFLQILDK